jgi:hypothetical protein
MGALSPGRLALMAGRQFLSGPAWRLRLPARRRARRRSPDAKQGSKLPR